MHIDWLLLCLALSSTACGNGTSTSGDASLDGNEFELDSQTDGQDDADEDPVASEDSDGDTILNADEDAAAGLDTDGDTVPDYLDLDSDCDTLTDSEEAGDDDPSTAPHDTDGDTIPDFQDPDSDADGLSDRLETELDLDPKNEDSDGDGVSDIVEFFGGWDPLDSGDNPLSRHIYFFVLPYNDPSDPPVPPLPPDPLLDVFVPTSGSVEMDMSMACRDDASDEMDACLLIESIEPNTTGGITDPMDPTKICASGLTVADVDGDTAPDTFVDVPADTVLCFDVMPATNRLAPCSSETQTLEAFMDAIDGEGRIYATFGFHLVIPVCNPDPSPGELCAEDP